MPTNTFLNLPENKKNKILEAAIDEFSEHNIGESSINKIVKGADISRGSFYTYFDDKYDLVHFLIQLIKKPLQDKIETRFSNSDGEFIEMMLIVHDEVYDLLENEKYHRFIKHVVLFFHNNIVNNINNKTFTLNKDNKLVLQYIDRNQFNNTNVTYLENVLRIAQTLLSDVFLEAMLKTYSKEESRKNYQMLLTILKTGYEES
ncbi:MAG: TetR/AcrR family transcriptional regulator [Candidatus Izimaplasma sp.]|nr:TetR/AcrR family transcriptional regulator [Candidatus Izimaplasma bacterium]